MNDDWSADLKRRFMTLQRLWDLKPGNDLAELEQAEAKMNDLISEEYEPYFSGNAALHILSRCQRCGLCCRNEAAVALSSEDSRRIARRLGLGLKKFMIEYTRPHALKDPQIGSARMVKRKSDQSCIFYDPSLPGCTVQEAKPQVCRAAYYLTKMNLLLCDQNHRFSSFPSCPADLKLRSELQDYVALLSPDPEAMDQVVQSFSSDRPEIRLFRSLLRLKGMEIYFGKETAEELRRAANLKRLPHKDELNEVAFLYAAALLKDECPEEHGRRHTI
ncbi:MAG: YkgJ family cysteine cluster protein [Methanotrichaceae archaeon]|nr:YkgJ family cysteine cluster protein [Methanotrichaceae archaeon]